MTTSRFACSNDDADAAKSRNQTKSQNHDLTPTSAGVHYCFTSMPVAVPLMRIRYHSRKHNGGTSPDNAARSHASAVRYFVHVPFHSRPRPMPIASAWGVRFRTSCYVIDQEPTLRLRELMLSPGYPAFPMKSRGGGTEIPIPRPLTQAHVEQMP